jgi:MFS family permease
MIKKWFISYGLQGVGLGSLMIVITLFVTVALHGNVQQATSAAALYSTGTLLGSLFVGNYLDKKPFYGKIVFYGFIASSIIAAIMPFAFNIKLYMACAILFGFSISMINPAITLYLSRNFDDEKYRKYINNFYLGNSLGITIGTFLGGYVLSILPMISEPDRMRVLFLVSALVFAISATISADVPKIKRIKPAGQKRRERNFVVSIRPIFASLRLIPRIFPKKIDFSIFSKEIKLYLIGVFTIFFGANLFFSPFPIYLKEILNIPSSTIFIMYGLGNVAATIAYLFTRHAMNRYRDFSIMRAVLWVRIFSFFGIVLFGVLGSIRWTIITFVLINFTWPFLYITSTVQATKLAKEENKGRVLGVFNMAISLAVILASFLSGILALHVGYYATFVTGATILFIGERITHTVAKRVPVPKEVLEKLKEQRSRKNNKSKINFKKLFNKKFRAVL